MNPFDVSGKVALITGSSRGIGRAIAHGLAQAGATVVLNGVNTDRLAQTKQEFVAEFGADHVRSSAFDVTTEEDVTQGIAAIEADLGKIDILINNAGIQHREPLLEVSVADWERVITTNLTSAFLVGRTVARGMINRGNGKIVNVASVQTDLARPTIAAYTASKGGIRNLTRAMTAEWAAHNIQINAIAPGYIHTEMTQNLVDDESFNAWILGRTPASRWGTTQDLVGPAIMLSSSASNFINGQVLFVDGGMTVIV